MLSDTICIKIIINVGLNINKSENIVNSCLLNLVVCQKFMQIPINASWKIH